jgi:tetratricopeptide (TPR) repeat protein
MMLEIKPTQLIVTTHYPVIIIVGSVATGWLTVGVIVATPPGIAPSGLELLSHLGIALLLSGGCLLTGWLIGSLFGVSHTVGALPPGEASRPIYWVSATLTADWLPKVLIGAALVTLPLLIRGDIKLPHLTIISGAPPSWNATVTYAIVFYFGVDGLICGYLLTRLAAAGTHLHQGIEIAFNLPVTELSVDKISSADRQALEHLRSLEPTSLRDDHQRLAWARAQIASGNLDKADMVYQELTKRNEDDPELLLERSLLLVRAGKLDEVKALRKRAVSLFELQGGEARPEIVLSMMSNDLYEAPPDGFERVITVGESLSKLLRAEPRYWVYLACAYGQKHAYSRQEEQDSAAVDLKTIRDRALFCVRQAIAINPKSRLELRLLWDPNATKEPVENDLETFYNDAQFQAVIEPDAAVGRTQQTRADDLRPFFVSPLVRYSGTVDVWVEDAKGLVSNLQKGMQYLLIVEFSSASAEKPRGVLERVEVLEGEERSEVPFDLHPDATDIRFLPEKVGLVVPRQGSPLRARFEFIAPPPCDKCEIWLEISQARRTIQMLQLTVRVT